MTEEMKETPGAKHGGQFEPERLKQGTECETIRKHYQNAFDARNIASAESGDVYDTYADEKPLHEIIDFAGIDYIVDTFDAIYGLNHRENQPGAKRRFDIRADTGTSAPSELEKARKFATDRAIGPRYASRLKRKEDGGVEWVRIIDLAPLVGAIENAQLEPHKKWNDGDVTAWLFDYSLLRNMDLIIYEWLE